MPRKTATMAAYPPNIPTPRMMPDSSNVPAFSIVYSWTKPDGISSRTTARSTPSAPTVIASVASAPPTRRARKPASSSRPPLSTPQVMSTMKNMSSVRQAGTPPAIPAIALTTARRIADQRDPDGRTSQAARMCTRAVTSAKPLKTARPTAAE